MKTMTKIALMMFIAAFASYANAADVKIEKGADVSVGVNADGSLKLKTNTKPNVAPVTKAKVNKKKISGKKKLVKKASAQVVPAAISPTDVSIEEAKKNLAELGDKNLEILPLTNNVSDTASVTKTAEVKIGYWKWNGQKNRSEWVTATAKTEEVTKTTKVGVKINVDLLSIFMPNKLTNASRCDHLSVSGVMNNNMPLKTENSVNGINTAAEPGVMNMALALRAKLGPFALDYQPMPVRRSRNTSVKGAPIGHVDIITDNKIVIELYAFEEFLKTYNSGLTLGAGYEYSRPEGNLMIGLGKIANEAGGWSSVYRATYLYYYNTHVSVFIGWERENIPLTHKILSAGLDTTTFEGGPFAGVNIGLF